MILNLNISCTIIVLRNAKLNALFFNKINDTIKQKQDKTKKFTLKNFNINLIEKFPLTDFIPTIWYNVWLFNVFFVKMDVKSYPFEELMVNLTSWTP